MNEEIAEIEKAINQASHIIETLARLEQRLQKQQQFSPSHNTSSPQQAQLVWRHANQAKLDPLALDRAKQTGKMLRAAVVKNEMTPGEAATQLLQVAPPELASSQRIILREAAKVAFETGGELSIVTKLFNKCVEPPKTEQRNLRHVISSK
jgi:hypothetical protein